jgi:hypothetical protein
MKRWFIIVITLSLIITPLFSTYYKSNSLGQALSELDENELDKERFVLEREQIDQFRTIEKLYDDKQLVLEIDTSILSKENNTLQVIRKRFDKEGNLFFEIKSEYKNGVPIKINRLENGSEILTLLNYYEEHLVESKELSDGNLLYITTYYRGHDGSLNGMRVIDASGEIKKSLYTNLDEAQIYSELYGDIFSQISHYPDNLTVHTLWYKDQPHLISNVYRDENGLLVVEEQTAAKTKRKSYSYEGLLLYLEIEEKEGDKSLTTFQYDPSGNLYYLSEVFGKENENKIEKWFSSNGSLQTETEWENEMPISSKRYISDGTSIITLFEKGKPYADVTYAPDGKRVLSIQYRMER